MSAVDTVIGEGLFFIYLGALLLKRPRIHSQGIFIDVFVIAFVFYSLSAFLPNVPYFFSDWRASAFYEYGINFGFMRTIMPLESLEAILMLIAAMVFYYHISSWKLNDAGKEAILIIFVLITILAGCIQYFLGNDILRFLVAEDYKLSPVKHYTDNLNLLYLVGGLGSVALFFDSFKSNKLVSVIGLMGVLLSLFFLIHNQSFFYYTLFYALSGLLILRNYFRGKSMFQKSLTLISLFVCVSGFLFLNQAWWNILAQDLGGFFFVKAKELWWLLYGSFKQLNIFGNGIATAHSILPQLSPLEYFKDSYSYRGSYLLTYLSDFGFIGLVAFILFLNYTFLRYFRLLNDSKIRHRFFYALVVIVFFVRFVLLAEGTAVGLLLLLLMFLHLSLRMENNRASIFSKKFCQLLGVFWLCLGMFWASLSMLNQPLLSDVRYRLSFADQYDANVNFKDITTESIEEKDALISKSDPKKYFLKSYQLLESKADEKSIIDALYSAALFDRNNPEIFLQLGYLLSDYDLNLAIDAWDAYFEHNPLAKMGDYKSLIYYSKSNYELLLSLERLSYLENEYAVEFALSLNDLDFQKYIENNPINQFFVSKRNLQFQFLRRLLEEGFFDRYSNYTSTYKNSIADLNILEAIKQKELANFEYALSILRRYILPEKIAVYQVNENKKYIPRVFLQNTPDVEMGVVLMKEEINAKNYEKALIYVDHILTMDNPPKYAYYWKAELLYRMRDYSDSWFAFIAYLEKANVGQFIKTH